jgi:hypothetical protein
MGAVADTIETARMPPDGWLGLPGRGHQPHTINVDLGDGE